MAETPLAANRMPATQNASVARSAKLTCGHGVLHSTSARSIIQCQPVSATIAE
jgi:hypothetical protein